MAARICLLTAFTPGYRDEFAVTRTHLEDYARRHNYEFRAIETEVAPRHGYWAKIEAIRETLKAPFDFILWVDTDALIVRKDIDVRSAIRPNIDVHLVWHDLVPEIHGDPAHYNAGVMLVRVSDWSRAFFDRVWETPLNHRWADQATILHLLGYDELIGIGPDRPNEEDRAHVARLRYRLEFDPRRCGKRRSDRSSLCGSAQIRQNALAQIRCDDDRSSRQIVCRRAP